jgi:hypothetical protein
VRRFANVAAHFDGAGVFVLEDRGDLLLEDRGDLLLEDRGDLLLEDRVQRGLAPTEAGHHLDGHVIGLGPRPPLVTIRSTPSSARNRSCAWMSRGTVTAGVMCARSTPSSISRSALQGRLRPSSPGEDLGSRHHDARPCTRPVSLAVVVGALGVVFGDIGTSPIYTVQTVFNPADPAPRANQYERLRRRVLDLLVGDDRRHADLHQPGDARRQRRRGRHHGAHHAAATVGRDPRSSKRVGAGRGRDFRRRRVFGDIMITPAITVLSAVEGLKVI